MNYRYHCIHCNNTLHDQGFAELYCGACKTFHNRRNLSINDVKFEQTLLVNSGGINWEWFHAITVFPGGFAKIVWEDRVHKGDKYFLGRCKAAKYATYFQICDKDGVSGPNREKNPSFSFNQRSAILFQTRVGFLETSHLEIGVRFL